jgi:hypothetical protein
MVPQSTTDMICSLVNIDPEFEVDARIYNLAKMNEKNQCMFYFLKGMEYLHGSSTETFEELFAENEKPQFKNKPGNNPMENQSTNQR